MPRSFAVIHIALLEQNLRLHCAHFPTNREGTKCLPAYSVVKELCSRFHRDVRQIFWRTIKNPASSAGHLRHTMAKKLAARLLSIRCSYLTSLRNGSYGAPMAGLQTPLKRNCLQPIQEYKDETRKRQVPAIRFFRSIVQIGHGCGKLRQRCGRPGGREAENRK